MCALARQPVKSYGHFYGQGGQPTAQKKCPLLSNNDVRVSFCRVERHHRSVSRTVRTLQPLNVSAIAGPTGVPCVPHATSLATIAPASQPLVRYLTLHESRSTAGTPTITASGTPRLSRAVYRLSGSIFPAVIHDRVLLDYLFRLQSYPRWAMGPWRLATPSGHIRSFNSTRLHALLFRFLVRTLEDR